MKVLLLSDTMPTPGNSLGTFLSQLCGVCPPGSLAVFVAKDGGAVEQPSAALSHVAHRVALKPGEFGLVGKRGQKVVRVAGMVREYGRRMIRVPPLINQAIAFGREQKVDAIWAVVSGQTIARMARSVARSLRVPLYIQLPDSFEATLLSRVVDPVNRRAAEQILAMSVRDSVSCSVATRFMAEEVEHRYGIKPIIIHPAISNGTLKSPASSCRCSGQLVIGFAGNAYSNDEWHHLVGALDDHQWRVGDREVSILTYGHTPPPTPGPYGRVRHQHFSPERELVDALSTEADILFCPQPFVRPFSTSARARIPQKLVTYLTTGRPILFHGPTDSAACDLLERSGGAALSTSANRISLWNALTRIAASESSYAAIALAGHKLAMAEFDSTQQQRLFSRFLTGAEGMDLASALPLPRHAPADGKRRRVATSALTSAVDKATFDVSKPHYPAVADRESSWRSYSLEADLQRLQSALDTTRQELIVTRDLLEAARHRLEEAHSREYANRADQERQVQYSDALAAELEGLRRQVPGLPALGAESDELRAREYVVQPDRHLMTRRGETRANQTSDIHGDQELAGALADRETERHKTSASETGALATVAVVALQRAEQTNAACAGEIVKTCEALHEQAGDLTAALELSGEEIRAAKKALEQTIQESIAAAALREDELMKRAALEAQMASLERALVTSKEETRAIERRLDEIVQERISLAHVSDVAELHGVAKLAGLGAELARMRADAERLTAERAESSAALERLQDRLEAQVRELHDTQLELVAQNARLASAETIAELRAQLLVVRVTSDASQAQARALESERKAEEALSTLTAVQRAHTEEIRAGIEFISQQVFEAKAVEAAEGRMAGRFSLLAADMADVKKSLISEAAGDERGVIGMRTLYLDLLEASLCGMLSSDPNIDRWGAHTFDKDKRLLGRDWPKSACTMIGAARMRNVRTLVERLIEDGVHGDLLEAGVWRGGACVYMKGILLAHGQSNRKVWLADSFSGLPVPDSEKYPADIADQHHEYAELSVTAEDVRRNFEAYGLMDEHVKFLEGWFKDTLPTAPVEELAMLRLDGDMYGSTMETLEALYHKVVLGGFIVVDDYILPPCRMAVTDFRTRMGIVDAIEEVDGAAVYWRKTSKGGKSARVSDGRSRRLKTRREPTGSRAS